MPRLGDLFRKSKKAKEEKVGKTRGVRRKAYLKAMPLRELSDLDAVKSEVSSGNILIIRITPLAAKSIEDVKRAVNEMREFIESINGDIARLGEERVALCPPNVKIWREETSVTGKPVPTAA